MLKSKLRPSLLISPLGGALVPSTLLMLPPSVSSSADRESEGIALLASFRLPGADTTTEGPSVLPFKLLMSIELDTDVPRPKPMISWESMTQLAAEAGASGTRKAGAETAMTFKRDFMDTPETTVVITLFGWIRHLRPGAYDVDHSVNTR